MHLLVLALFSAGAVTTTCPVSPSVIPLTDVRACGFLRSERGLDALVRVGVSSPSNPGCGGVLLAEDSVLTAGHCSPRYVVDVYSSDGSSRTEVSVMNESVTSFPSLDLVLFQVPGISKTAGSLGVGPEYLAPGDDIQPGSLIVIANVAGGAIHTRVTAVSDTRIEYDAETRSGWSGSAILDWRGRVVGLHLGQTTAGPPTLKKTGVRLSPILANTGAGQVAARESLARLSQPEFIEYPRLDLDDQRWLLFTADFPVATGATRVAKLVEFLGRPLPLIELWESGNRVGFRASIEPARANGQSRIYVTQLGDAFARASPFPSRTNFTSPIAVRFPSPSIQLNVDTGVLVLSSVDSAPGFTNYGLPNFREAELCLDSWFMAASQCLPAGTFAPANWSAQYNLPAQTFRIPRAWWSGLTQVRFRVADSHSTYVAETSAIFTNGMPSGRMDAATCSCVRFTNDCTLVVSDGTAADTTPSWTLGPVSYRLELPPLPGSSPTPRVQQQYTSVAPMFSAGFLPVPFSRSSSWWGPTTIAYRVVTYEPAWFGDPEFFVSLSRPYATDTSYNTVECQEVF